MNRNYQTILDKAKGQRSLLQKQITDTEKKIEDNKVRRESLEKAQTFLQSVAQDTQEQLKYHVEDIVQLALDTCFPEKYEFRIVFEVSRGTTTAVMKFIDIESGQPIDPMNASGGGVVDLAAFALRIAAWTLEGNTDNTMLMDEPLKFLSKDLMRQAANVMKTLSKKLNLQFIFVSHIPELTEVSNRIFEVKLNKHGKSIIKQYV